MAPEIAVKLSFTAYISLLPLPELTVGNTNVGKKVRLSA
jgi:hypothetical protein